MIKLLIAGSRDFDDYEKLSHIVTGIIRNLDRNNILIIEGGARGTDKLARRYAEEHSLPYRTYEANWDEYGKSAGYRRNQDMGAVATHAILFWDGLSKGTKHMLDIIEQKMIPYRLIRIKPNEHSRTETENHQTHPESFE